MIRPWPLDCFVNNILLTKPNIFFYLGFISWTLTIHTTTVGGRRSSKSSLALPSAHKHWDVYLELCIWDMGIIQWFKELNSLLKKLLKFMAPFYGWGSTNCLKARATLRILLGGSLLFSTSSQKFLVLILLTSEGWKTESTQDKIPGFGSWFLLS